MGGIEQRISTLRALLRAEPVETGLFLLGPLFLAAVQLSNSLVNDLSLAISVPFAVVLLSFSGLLTQYQVARHRCRELHGEFDPETTLYPTD